MASGKRRERGTFERPTGSGIWWVRYADGHGRLHREKVGPKALARKVYEKRKTEIREGRFFPQEIRRQDPLLADAVDDYLERKSGVLRHFRHYLRLGRHWKDAFRGRTLGQITPGDIESYVARRARDAAPATVNRELAFLKRIYNDAIANRLAGVNPVRAVKMFKENNARVRFLAEEEETPLRAAMSEDSWALVAIALNTGLRQAEQFNLRWEHVDFGTGLITIPRSKHGEVRRVPIK